MFWKKKKEYKHNFFNYEVKSVVFPDNTIVQAQWKRTINICLTCHSTGVRSGTFKCGKYYCYNCNTCVEAVTIEYYFDANKDLTFVTKVNGYDLPRDRGFKTKEELIKFILWFLEN